MQKITPEMAVAWTTLQEYAIMIHTAIAPTARELKVAVAIDILDNSDFMIPVEELRNEVETAAQFVSPDDTP